MNKSLDYVYNYSMRYVITQIAQAKRNSERVNIYLNDKFWLGLSKNALISLKLVNGKELTDLEKHEIEKTALSTKSIDTAIRFMQIRPRSCAEVRDYLIYRKAMTEDDTENVITYLQEQGALSDEKFAQWYVEYKLNSGVNGINKVKTELLRKKVNREIITNILEKLSVNDEFQHDQLLKIEEYAKKIIKTIKAKDAYDLKSKLIGRLMAKGFKYDDIKRVLKTLEESVRNEFVQKLDP